MAYENIKKIVSKSIRKITFTWVLFFLIIIGAFTLYSIENQTTQFMNDQILAISEIDTEITSVLYYNSQQSIAGEVDYEKTLLKQWITLQGKKYNNIIPQSTPEVNYLNELGQSFYSSDILKDKEDTVLAYQKLSDQLDLLKRMSFNYIQNSLSLVVIPIIPFFLAGILLIIIVLTFLFANSLQKKLIIKNEFILEDIWNELQGFEFSEENTEYNSFNSYQEEEIETIYYPGTQKINSLINSSKELSNNILLTKEQLLNHSPQNFANTQENIEHPKISEKMIFIQKLLSRLFTRAERAAALAKATADNGFQAGILSLNISIEAARAGESGRNFIPISDRVKDFAEKSNQIGRAILEELKDVDLSIRKAYAMSKGIIEEINSFSTDTQSEQGKISQTQPIGNQPYLQDIIIGFDQMFELSQYIQSISSELETSIEVPKTTTYTPTLVDNSPKQSLFLKEILLRSFERLYRFNYGIDPPNNPFSQEK